MQFRLSILVLILVAQHVAGLILEPRIDENPKFSLQNSIRQEKDEYSKKHRAGEYNMNSLNATLKMESDASDIGTNLEDNELLERPRFTLSEPYRSLIQTTTRFAIAQSSMTNYIHIDTFMDLINDTGYMLASPYILNKTLRVTAIVLAALMTVLFFVPPVYWKSLGSGWRQTRGRLLEIEKYLPNGLNEMGIIHMLEEKTDELLARFELNSSACRQQSICQAGELLRCAFPRGSKWIVSFISENFSRPRYRDHEYIGSFLRGFIDQNCAANTEMDQSKTCFSSMIKSLSHCSKTGTSQAQQSRTSKSSNGTGFVKSKPEQQLQTLQAARA